MNALGGYRRFLIGGRCPLATPIETVEPLNNTAGNILYFFSTLALMNVFYTGTVANGFVSGITGYFDPFGYAPIYVAPFRWPIAAKRTTKRRYCDFMYFIFHVVDKKYTISSIVSGVTLPCSPCRTW